MVCSFRGIHGVLPGRRARKGSCMARRFLLMAGAAAGLVATFVPQGAVGPTGVACVISGTANLSPPVTTKSVQTHYTFSGSLTPCKSTDGTLKSGTVTASGDIAEKARV